MSMRGERDEFGDRMKAYEAEQTARSLDPRLPIYARIDGRSFSTFTRGMERPFDRRMSAAMVETTKRLVRDTHARLGYTQSDEISLVYMAEGPGSEPLFGGKVLKLTSILASLAASAFQRAIISNWPEPEASALADCLPHFDARVLSMPSTIEATNAILWRVMDARKNAVSMAARSLYSAKALHLKDQQAMRSLLAEKGVVFDDYPRFFRWGSFVRRVSRERELTLAERERIPERHRPPEGGRVVRTEVVEIDMPDFHTVENRVAVVFDGADPISCARAIRTDRA